MPYACFRTLVLLLCLTGCEIASLAVTGYEISKNYPCFGDSRDGKHPYELAMSIPLEGQTDTQKLRERFFYLLAAHHLKDKRTPPALREMEAKLLPKYTWSIEGARKDFAQWKNNGNPCYEVPKRDRHE